MVTSKPSEILVCVDCRRGFHYLQVYIAWKGDDKYYFCPDCWSHERASEFDDVEEPADSCGE